MPKMSVEIKMMRDLMWWLVVIGFVGVIMGILIFIYPELLNILVAIALIAVGVSAWVAAMRVSKMSKLEVSI